MATTDRRKPAAPTGKKAKGAYEPPRLEKFEKLEKLIVSGE
jgi:hypothetical protein